MKVKCNKVNDKEFTMTYVLDEKTLKSKLEQTEFKINSLKNSIQLQTQQLEILECEYVELKKILE